MTRRLPTRVLRECLKANAPLATPAAALLALAIVSACGGSERARTVAKAPLEALKRPEPRSARGVDVEVRNESTGTVVADLLVWDDMHENHCTPERADLQHRELGARSRARIRSTLECRGGASNQLDIRQTKQEALAEADLALVTSGCLPAPLRVPFKIRVRDVTGVETTHAVTDAPYLTEHGINDAHWVEMGPERHVLEAELRKNRVRTDCASIEVLRFPGDVPLAAIGIPEALHRTSPATKGVVGRSGGYVFFETRPGVIRFTGLAQLKIDGSDKGVASASVRCDDRDCRLE